MKLTKTKLKQIIKEEIANVLEEQPRYVGYGVGDEEYDRYKDCSEYLKSIREELYSKGWRFVNGEERNACVTAGLDRGERRTVDELIAAAEESDNTGIEKSGVPWKKIKRAWQKTWGA
jgi:hypothetical protein